MMTHDAASIHARLAGGAWTEVLGRLGVAEDYLRGRRHPGPCPMCGGRDRYVYDDRRGRGDYFCRQCGPGDGFALLMKLHRWDFTKACREVAQAAGISPNERPVRATAQPTPAEPASPASPSPLVWGILRGACDPGDLKDAREYLQSRGLWPLPQSCKLRAHPSVEYREEGKRVGRFPALIAAVRDVTGCAVTLHRTYLSQGRKLTGHEPRKLLSPLTHRRGCAVRLTSVHRDVLGIAEGIETALSAQKLHEVPTWAALNTSLLAKFEPPPGVRKVIVFADRDTPGLEAAGKLIERLNGRLATELCNPTSPYKDWNDVLTDCAPEEAA